jgi:hypothetical protein
LLEDKRICSPLSNITCFTFYIHLWPIYWLCLVTSTHNKVPCSTLVLRRKSIQIRPEYRGLFFLCSSIFFSVLISGNMPQLFSSNYLPIHISFDLIPLLCNSIVNNLRITKTCIWYLSPLRSQYNHQIYLSCSLSNYSINRFIIYILLDIVHGVY